MSSSPPLGSTPLTPGRSTVLTLDASETVLICPDWKVRADGAEIAKFIAQSAAQGSVPGAATGTAVASASEGAAVNMRFWPASGAWTTALLQDNIANLHQYVDTLGLIVTASQLNIATVPTSTGGTQPVLSSEGQWTQQVLVGVTYATQINTSGDYFLTKRIPAGQTWANTISGATHATPAEITYGVAFDRVAVSSTPYPVNQGYFLRWIAPGSDHAHDDWHWGFFFGQYALYFSGSGKVRLYEYCNDASGNPQTRLRKEYRFCQPSDATDQPHSMAIWPHVGPNGELLLSFTNLTLDTTDTVSGTARTDLTTQSATEVVYRGDQTQRGTDQDPAGGNVTAAAKFQVDVRRDLRLKFQVSRLGFAQSGSLADLPRQLPDAFDNTNPILMTISQRTTGSDSITPAIMDVDTGTAYVQGTTTSPYALFTFSTSGTTTPILWAYKLTRGPVTTTTPDNSLVLNGGASTSGLTTPIGGVSQVNLVAASGDPAQQTGTIGISDPTGVAARLQTRGLLTAAIATSYTPRAGQTNAGVPQSVALFRGYGYRPTWEAPKGTTGRNEGFGQYGGASHYPSNNWRNYQLPVQGMWMRLQRRDWLGSYGARVRNYTSDPASPSMPWKVTDAIVDLLKCAGFPSTMIAVPDKPVRLWPAYAQNVQDAWVTAGDNLADIIVRWCRNYLGAYLFFDENNGSQGAWTVLFPPPYLSGTSTYAPVWNFVTAAAPGKMPMTEGSYPLNTGPILGRLGGSTIPPDYNCIHVVGPYAASAANALVKCERYLYNYQSYAVPGSTVTLDPTDPDYIGQEMKLTVVDPSLGNSSSVTETQGAVDWTGRRLFDALCHAELLEHIRAPLAIIYDPNGYYRPLRFLDPVSLDGDASWLVKGVTFDYVKDWLQTAQYELVKPTSAGQFIKAGHEGLGFQRRAGKAIARRATGHATGSIHHGLIGVTASAEQRMLALPTATGTRYKIQNADGSFIPIANYNVRDGLAG